MNLRSKTFGSSAHLADQHSVTAPQDLAVPFFCWVTKDRTYEWSQNVRVKTERTTRSPNLLFEEQARCQHKTLRKADRCAIIENRCEVGGFNEYTQMIWPGGFDSYLYEQARTVVFRHCRYCHAIQVETPFWQLFLKIVFWRCESSNLCLITMTHHCSKLMVWNWCESSNLSSNLN